MKKALAISGLLALSITPPVWSKGDNALPPSPVWEEEMMLIALDMDEFVRQHNEQMKGYDEEMKRYDEKRRREKRRREKMKKDMKSMGWQHNEEIDEETKRIYEEQEKMLEDMKNFRLRR
tara:strand:+ start:77 stop:436 length:360 start_codon:yes stop_codon:yes gene_type:complete